MFSASTKAPGCLSRDRVCIGEEKKKRKKERQRSRISLSTSKWIGNVEEDDTFQIGLFDAKSV